MQEDMSQEMGEALMRQAFEVWINPEVERRRQKGALSTQIELVAAQIVFHSERPVEIRLNDEVRAKAQVRLNRSVEKGEAVRVEDLADILNVELTGEDVNSAHTTLIRTEPDRWVVTFNAQYNRQRAKVLASAADQYIQMAELALGNGFYRAFVDNLHSALELAAKAQLILIPNPKMLTSKSHEYVVGVVPWAETNS
jgi:hypothetical protein